MVIAALVTTYMYCGYDERDNYEHRFKHNVGFNNTIDGVVHADAEGAEARNPTCK